MATAIDISKSDKELSNPDGSKGRFDFFYAADLKATLEKWGFGTTGERGRGNTIEWKHNTYDLAILVPTSGKTDINDALEIIEVCRQARDMMAQAKGSGSGSGVGVKNQTWLDGWAKSNKGFNARIEDAKIVVSLITHPEFRLSLTSTNEQKSDKSALENNFTLFKQSLSAYIKELGKLKSFYGCIREISNTGVVTVTSPATGDKITLNQSWENFATKLEEFENTISDKATPLTDRWAEQKERLTASGFTLSDKNGVVTLSHSTLAFYNITNGKKDITVKLHGALEIPTQAALNSVDKALSEVLNSRPELRKVQATPGDLSVNQNNGIELPSQAHGLSAAGN